MTILQRKQNKIKIALVSMAREVVEAYKLNSFSVDILGKIVDETQKELEAIEDKYNEILTTGGVYAN